MKPLLLLAFVLLSLGVTAPVGEAVVCVDGCSSMSVSIGDFVRLGPANAGSCTACGSGTVYAYKIYKTSGCGGTDQGPQGTFCSTSSTAGSQTYEVNSIGSECTGTPQGCVRLCVCP